MKFLPLLLLIAFLSACKDKDDSGNSKDFSCIKVADLNSQPLGYHGCDKSDDWTLQTLSGSEEEYFLKNDTVSLVGTIPTEITGVGVFPNPAPKGGFFNFRLHSTTSGNPVKVQLAIIDESENVILQHSLRLESDTGVAVELPADKFNLGQYYRVYYRVSAEGKPVLFEGYGNMLVCKNGPIGNIDTDCF